MVLVLAILRTPQGQKTQVDSSASSSASAADVPSVTIISSEVDGPTSAFTLNTSSKAAVTKKRNYNSMTSASTSALIAMSGRPASLENLPSANSPKGTASASNSANATVWNHSTPLNPRAAGRPMMMPGARTMMGVNNCPPVAMSQQQQRMAMHNLNLLAMQMRCGNARLIPPQRCRGQQPYPIVVAKQPCRYPSDQSRSMQQFPFPWARINL